MRFAVRVDGGVAVGLGHVYKSLWLAEAIRRRGHEVFFLITRDPATLGLIRGKNFDFNIFPEEWTEEKKIRAVNEFAQIRKPDCLITDHWDWPCEYWTCLLKNKGTVYVAIDIPKEGFHRYDLAFQGIRNSLTNKESVRNGCKVYEGPRYLMLSENFLPYKDSWKAPSSLRNILLTFGGTDAGGFSLKILEFFEKYPRGFNLSLVLGPGYTEYKRIKEYLKNSGLSVRVHQDVSCLPAHMCKSDLVISTAGAGSLSELALTRTPGIVFAAVQHQLENAEKFSQLGGVLNCAGHPGIIDERKLADYIDALYCRPISLRDLSDRWQGLVDGNGLKRMVRIIEQYVHCQ